MGKMMDKTKGAANEAMGKVKVAVGDRTHDPEMVASGVKQRGKGQAQKMAGKIKGAMGDKI